MGIGIEMDAILAVALGGNLLSGGKFSIAGSVIGAYTIQTITTTLYAMNVRADQLNVFKAFIIILIIVISSDVFKREFRKITQNIFNKTATGSNAEGTEGGVNVDSRS